MDNNICRICNTKNNAEEYTIKEMMFGLSDEFEYFRCSNCGCLQLKLIPNNMEKYYPSNYLNFPKAKRSMLKKFLMSKREKSYLSRKGIFGKILIFLFGFSDPDLLWVSEANIQTDDFILDVGCGKGDLLKKLKKSGFKNLLGIDAFIENDIIYDEQLKIIKKDFSQFDGIKFDWIMFHHSFEHLQDPSEAIKKLSGLLNPHGRVLIRIPVVDSYAWEYYKTNWIQLDPPRHYFIHSKKSIEYLANRFNFKIKKIIYDSTAFQFLGSEQCKRQIPLMSPESYFINPNNSIFGKEELIQYSEKAKELNLNQKGDTACFFLQKEN
jgi:SAM-dependent methyltransferase